MKGFSKGGVRPRQTKQYFEQKGRKEPKNSRAKKFRIWLISEALMSLKAESSLDSLSVFQVHLFLSHRWTHWQNIHLLQCYSTSYCHYHYYTGLKGKGSAQITHTAAVRTVTTTLCCTSFNNLQKIKVAQKLGNYTIKTSTLRTCVKCFVLNISHSTPLRWALSRNEVGRIREGLFYP